MGKKKTRLSEGASIILAYLNAKGIVYRLEATYTNCRDKRKLPFDFEIIVSGRVGVIEFDGQQHFVQSSRFHATAEDFERQKRHDITKTRYCYDNNIGLLRIDYSFNTKEKIWPLLDAYIESLKVSAPAKGERRIYQFSDITLYKQHYNVCNGSNWCVVM